MLGHLMMRFFLNPSLRLGDPRILQDVQDSDSQPPLLHKARSLVPEPEPQSVAFGVVPESRARYLDSSRAEHADPVVVYETTDQDKQWGIQVTHKCTNWISTARLPPLSTLPKLPSSPWFHWQLEPNRQYLWLENDQQETLLFRSRAHVYKLLGGTPITPLDKKGGWVSNPADLMRFRHVVWYQSEGMIDVMKLVKNTRFFDYPVPHAGPSAKARVWRVVNFDTHYYMGSEARVKEWTHTLQYDVSSQQTPIMAHIFAYPLFRAEKPPHDWATAKVTPTQPLMESLRDQETASGFPILELWRSSGDGSCLFYCLARVLYDVWTDTSRSFSTSLMEWTNKLFTDQTNKLHIQDPSKLRQMSGDVLLPFRTKLEELAEKNCPEPHASSVTRLFADFVQSSSPATHETVSRLDSMSSAFKPRPLPRAKGPAPLGVIVQDLTQDDQEESQPSPASWYDTTDEYKCLKNLVKIKENYKAAQRDPMNHKEKTHPTWGGDHHIQWFSFLTGIRVTCLDAITPIHKELVPLRDQFGNPVCHQAFVVRREESHYDLVVCKSEPHSSIFDVPKLPSGRHALGIHVVESVKLLCGLVDPDPWELSNAYEATSVIYGFHARPNSSRPGKHWISLMDGTSHVPGENKLVYMSQVIQPQSSSQIRQGAIWLARSLAAVRSCNGTLAKLNKQLKLDLYVPQYSTRNKKENSYMGYILSIKRVVQPRSHLFDLFKHLLHRLETITRDLFGDELLSIQNYPRSVTQLADNTFRIDAPEGITLTELKGLRYLNLELVKV